MDREIIVSEVKYRDLTDFCEAMSQIPWQRDNELYKNYIREHEEGKRVFLYAKYGNLYAGHVSLLWESVYYDFKTNSIPEISDLLVIPKFHRMGIAKILLRNCEDIALSRGFDKCGLGVGLYEDYGPAQLLYMKSGYQLNGKGITTMGNLVKPGSEVTVDD